MTTSPARSSILRAAVLILGLVVPQFVLYGPSLLGRRVLLPLDVLTIPHVYLPADQVAHSPGVWDVALQDPVLQIEIFRRYAVHEIRAGRFPLWNPLNYCGAPFLAANQSAVLSPYRLLDYAFPGTLIIAWSEVVRALVAGVGAYLFFRRVMGVDFLPGAIGAWCWPLTGVFVLWMSFPVSHVVTWLGWMLLATDRAIRRPRGWGVILLALFTCAALLSGHAATAGQVMIASGVYAIGIVLTCRSCRRLACIVAVLMGWILGIGLSAPQTLATLDYVQHSYRVMDRSAGAVETPPVGPSAAAQLIMPYIDGATTSNTLYLGRGNRLESAASGSAGIFLTLLLAPLGFCNRRLRWMQWIWLAMAIVGAAQVLDLPLLARALDHPPMSLLRNNRMVFLFGWSVVASSVAGLEWARRGGINRWLPIVIAGALLAIAGWCGYGGAHLPTGVVRQDAGIQSWFVGMFHAYAMVCILGAICALGLVLIGKGTRAGWCAMIGALAMIELIATAWRVNPQCDPSLYYPRLAIFDAIAQAPPGRICGVQCLPANLNQTAGLSDVRGYDAADPARMIELLDLFRHPNAQPGYSYARVQWWAPIYPSPLADLLDLRYLIMRTPPPEGTQTMGGYWVIENRSAMGRTWVPKSIQTINDKAQRLRLLAEPAFRPDEIAYVETDRPISFQNVSGSARIVQDLPEQVTIEAQMQTPGLLLLADNWDGGWTAFCNERRMPVLRVDHALRGVVLPAGNQTVMFTYAPASFRWGLIVAAICAAALVTYSLNRRIRRLFPAWGHSAHR